MPNIRRRSLMQYYQKDKNKNACVVPCVYVLIIHKKAD